MGDHLLAQTVGWLLAAITALLGGAAVKANFSAKRKQKAEDDSNVQRSQQEQSYFATALQEITDDRDHWRKTAEQAWEKQRADALETARQMVKLQTDIGTYALTQAKRERDYRHWRAEFMLKVRLFKRFNPDIDTSLIDTGPAPLLDASDSNFGE